MAKETTQSYDLNRDERGYSRADDFMSAPTDEFKGMSKSVSADASKAREDKGLSQHLGSCPYGCDIMH